MRFKLIGSALVLLLTAPLYAQEESSLVVRNLNATPTVVRTNEYFIQEYEVSFLDFTDEGEEVVVREELLDIQQLGDFDVVDFSIKRTVKQGDLLEHVWVLRYTLRIINPKRAAYKIPEITIPWTRKKLGQDKNDSSLVWYDHIKTAEVVVRYDTTIVGQDPRLDIRDRINFGDHYADYILCSSLSWFLGIVPPGVFLILVIRDRRRSRRAKNESETGTKKDKTDKIPAVKTISRGKALRHLRQAVKKLNKSELIPAGELVQIEGELLLSLKNFLRAELALPHDGYTPADMAEHIRNKVKGSVRKDILLGFAEAAMRCQDCVDKNSSLKRNKEEEKLRELLKRFNWHARLGRV